MLDILRGIGIADLVDILFVALLFYSAFVWLKRTRAAFMVRGLFVLVAIYIAFRFEWIYGVAAVIAVFHDTLVTIGLFSIFNKEISLTVIAALLTLVGGKAVYGEGPFATVEGKL